MFSKLRKLLISVVAGLLVAAAAHGAMFDWSKTAGSNSTADATINWSEGQSPSSVNDSARAMMARIAEYRDDISGSLATAGTSTAYTLTTNQVLASTPINGQMIAFVAHVTNGTAPTLAVDGGTAYALQSASGTAVVPNTLIIGTAYSAVFKTATNTWIMRNFYGQPAIVPIGAVLPYSGSTAPNSNFVLAHGQCISRTTYAVYFALVSTTYGACDGSTTFGVPDMRGRMVAGLDNMGGSAASRITATSCSASTTLGTGCGSQSVTLTTTELPAHTHSVTGSTSSDGSQTPTTSGQSATHTHVFTGVGQSVTHAHNFQRATSVTINVNTQGAAAGGSFSAITGATAVVNETTTATGNASNDHSHDGGTGTGTADHSHTVSVAAHSHTLTGTAASTGSGAAAPVLNPVLMMTYIVRII